ncbi:TPA: hypothetical protein ACX6RK_001356 [Photobacterium damselae]
MIELLTQIVILLTAVVGLVKLSGLKSDANPGDCEDHKKVVLPSWLNGFGELIEFASIYAFILIPLGMMYAFMWITNEMSSIGSDEDSDTKNIAVIEKIEEPKDYEILRGESEQAFFNIVLAKEATTTLVKHELLEKAYNYALENKAYENALFAAKEYSRTSERNKKLEELVVVFNKLGMHGLSLKAAKEVSSSSLKNDLLGKIYMSANHVKLKPNKLLQPTAQVVTE